MAVFQVEIKVLFDSSNRFCLKISHLTSIFGTNSYTYNVMRFETCWNAFSSIWWIWLPLRFNEVNSLRSLGEILNTDFKSLKLRSRFSKFFNCWKAFELMEVSLFLERSLKSKNENKNWIMNDEWWHCLKCFWYSDDNVVLQSTKPRNAMIF